MSTTLVASGTLHSYTLEGVYKLLLNYEEAKEQINLAHKKLRDTFKGSCTTLVATSKSKITDIYTHTKQVSETGCSENEYE